MYSSANRTSAHWHIDLDELPVVEMPPRGNEQVLVRTESEGIIIDRLNCPNIAKYVQQARIRLPNGKKLVVERCPDNPRYVLVTGSLTDIPKEAAGRWTSPTSLFQHLVNAARQGRISHGS